MAHLDGMPDLTGLDDDTTISVVNDYLARRLNEVRRVLQERAGHSFGAAERYVTISLLTNLTLSLIASPDPEHVDRLIEGLSAQMRAQVDVARASLERVSIQ